MLLSEFDFELPESLIARYPAEKRELSRLLHYNLESEILKHGVFEDIVEILKPGDILVRNKTKVLPARFRVPIEDKEVEVLLVEQITEDKFTLNGIDNIGVGELVWRILAKPGKKLKNLESFEIAKGIEVELLKKQIEGKQFEFFVIFANEEDFENAVSNFGEMPIPPYMKRKAEQLDKERYQTTFAEEKGMGSSIAAPTAGLHFTKDLDQKLKDKGVDIFELTLHVGIGTFAPIRCEKIEEHQMHSEVYEASLELWRKILEAKKSGNRVIAVGTTSIRTLESIAKFHIDKYGDLETIEPEFLSGATDIYIYPPEFQFQIISGMVTNFHLPQSSLFLLISAFLGTKKAKDLYAEAIEKEYRFYSYGDACLFLK